MTLDPKKSPDLFETQLTSVSAFQGGFLKVPKDTVQLPDGKVVSREFIRHPGAVVILPLFDDDTVLLERQFRYPLNQVFIEFPAGKIDSGEEALACAKRELLEETGYTASNWRYLRTIHNAIAYSDEHLDIFIATGLTEGKSQLDDGEFLEVFQAPLSDVLKWIQSGEITDVKTIIGAFWLEKIQKMSW
jgi:ADP-ribose pyrophosphatase